MRTALIAFISASAVAFTVAFLPLATKISASSCDDVKFIFARGSGQELLDRESLTFQAEITSFLNDNMPDLSHEFYELGSSEIAGYKYPAVDLGFISAISTSISSGEAFKFNDSVQQGIGELKNYISNVTSNCSNTKFVLGGYSQGAMVITKALPDLDPKKIIYVANFGDPKLYLPEGEGIIPDACRGKNLSSYRIFAPNCRTSAGYLNAQKPYSPTNWEGKIGLWCNDKDFICGAGIILTKLFESHVKYATDGHIYSAAQIIGKKLKDSFPDKNISGSQDTNMPRDTVILLDTTTSMNNKIEKAKTKILEIAKKTIGKSGFVSLWTFGDIYDTEPIRYTDFGDGLAEIQEAFGHLNSSPGGYDSEESVLSALLKVMNNQNWHHNATKSIVVLTDEFYLSPDRDGTTEEQVIQKSLEIDPVNIFVVCTSRQYQTSYQKITDATNGGTYQSFNEKILGEELLNRINIVFPIDQYFGMTNEELLFSAITDEAAEKYEWDLDFDGLFETTTDSPSISKTYENETSGFVQVRATSASGLVSTASAKVIIDNNLSIEPDINIRNISKQDGTLKVEYEKLENTIATLVLIDEAPIGINYQDSIKIDQYNENSSISFIPISNEGDFGKIHYINGQGIENKEYGEVEDGGYGNTLEKKETFPVVLAPNSGRR